MSGHPQVVLFTATMPEQVAEQAAKWCRRAISCRVEGEDTGASISKTVVQVRLVSKGKSRAKCASGAVHGCALDGSWGLVCPC